MQYWFITPIYNEDAVSSFVSLMNLPLSHPKTVVNIAGDEILSLRDIVFSISKIIDQPPNIKETDEDPKHLCGDNQNLKNIFGVRNFIDFGEGIRKTLSQ